MKKARIIAFYLPQYHPVKENDEIWGKGFTEWVNVAKARPLFKGHYQPQLPSELGFYDLRDERVRVEQAELAKEYGIEGFCYWHYWFGNGKQILEMPFNEVVSSGKPDFPFCLAWANHSWSTKTWNNVQRNTSETVFLKQEYLGRKDYEMHFYALLRAFKDERYIRVDGKLLFVIFDPDGIPENDLKEFIDTWRELAEYNNLPGFFFVGRSLAIGKLTTQNVKMAINGENPIGKYNKLLTYGFDGVWSNNLRRAEISSNGFASFVIKRFMVNKVKIPLLDRYRYEKIIANFFTEADKEEYVIPMILPRWDKTPRQGKKADIIYGSTPQLFEKHVEDAIEVISKKKEEHRILFLQAWNEWGEGNYMEPDCVFGRQYLEALHNALNN